MDSAFESSVWHDLGTPESNVDAAFESWVGQCVVMQVALDEFNVSLRGIFLKSRMDNVLLRLDHGLTIEIPKAWILAIEEGRCANPSHDSTLLRDCS